MSTRREAGPRIQYPSYAHALAGAGGGLATVMLLHPLDTIRTRMQSTARSMTTPPPAGVPHVHKSADFVRALRAVVKREGAIALYRGAVPAATGSVLSWACYFHFFQRANAALRPVISSDTVAHLVSGAVAGAITSLATNPIWVVKVRLQLQSMQHMRVPCRDGVVVRPPYAGFFDGLRCIAREEGLRGLYKGIGPSLWLVSHGALQFTLYENFKAALQRDAPVSSATSVSHSLLASTASKLVASVATYPMQVARTRMQERFADGRMYGRLHTAFMHIFSTEGLRGLYRGLTANIVRVTPQAAVTFITYEQVLGLCARKHASNRT